MAVVLISRSTVTRGGVRSLSTRTVLCLGLAVVMSGFVLSFVGGVWLGRSTVESELAAATANVVAPNPGGERFATDRLGKLAARMSRLESDAKQMLDRIAGMENIERKLAGLQRQIQATAVAPEQLPSRGGAGGPALPPRSCDAQSLGGAWLNAERRLQRAEATAACLQDVLSRVQDAAAARQLVLMALPTRQPVLTADVGSSFGNRVDPIHRRMAFHSGLDFAAETGTPIQAAGGGRVRVAAFQPEMGNMVEIDHGNGLVTRYAHASRLHVKAGDLVAPGQLIAEVGNTGRSTGPHLHFEVLHEGRFVNPAYYLALASERK